MGVDEHTVKSINVMTIFGIPPVLAEPMAIFWGRLAKMVVLIVFAGNTTLLSFLQSQTNDLLWRP